MKLEGLHPPVLELKGGADSFGIWHPVGDICGVVAVGKGAIDGLTWQEANAARSNVDFAIEDHRILGVEVDRKVVHPDADVVELEQVSDSNRRLIGRNSSIRIQGGAIIRLIKATVTDLGIS